MKTCRYCGKEFESLKTHSHHCTERSNKNRRILEENGKDIISLYEKGVSLNEIKKQFGIGWGVVEKYLKLKNIRLRTLAESYTPHVKEKQKDAIERTYGKRVDNVSQLQAIKDKVKKTMLEKYGVENISHSQRFKDFMYILKGNTIDTMAFNKYKQEIWKLTKKNKENIPFTGLCYYTGVNISKTNFYNDFHHVSVDHKISISYGFNNNIPVEEIAAEKNLCYCSRLTNSIKREMTEEEFLKSDAYRRLIAYEDKINTESNH
jgi:hypothetical protein